MVEEGVEPVEDGVDDEQDAAEAVEPVVETALVLIQLPLQIGVVRLSHHHLHHSGLVAIPRHSPIATVVSIVSIVYRMHSFGLDWISHRGKCTNTHTHTPTHDKRVFG